MRYNRNMRKKITIIAVILLLLVLLLALWMIHLATPQKTIKPLTGDECTQNGGEIVNTIGGKTWNDNQIIGAVTNLRCPCLCIKK